MSTVFQHKTVLLKEAVSALALRPDGVYVDGTFGRVHVVLDKIVHLHALDAPVLQALHDLLGQ